MSRDMIDLFQSLFDERRDARGAGAVSPAAYDTAWVAMVPDPTDPTQPAFPRALPALLAMQEPNGAFAAQFPYNLVPSLAAALCLARIPWGGEEAENARHRVVGWLREALPRWDVARFEAIAFELVVPHLLRELDAEGIHLAFPARERLLALSEAKLALLDPESLYRRPSPLVYSLEAFEGRLDYTRCGGLKRHGGYGASPAATAAALMHGHWDPDAVAWLSRVERGGALPVVWPIDHFEMSWATCDFLRGNPGRRRTLPRSVVTELTQALSQACTPEGVATSAGATWPCNADDTGANLAAQLYLGLSPDVDVLFRWFRGTHFTTMEGERNPSLSTNAHVLEALAIADPTPRRQDAGEAAARFLLDSQAADGSFTDKWHASPFYATACAVHALRAWGGAHVQPALARARRWVLSQFRDEGGWGRFAATSEETAYAVAVLGTDRTEPRTAQCLFAARELLEGPVIRADLWVSKQLYTPERVVEATVLSARQDLAELRHVAA
ncbi:MAG: hypothetical protein EP330_12835 [Deltaproteobacteria bacterium]|nr:MAG: hypothetical protein EP330_12835 [Deltaproteobacteria bacterium]